MLLATPTEPVVLSMMAADGRTDLYGQALIYNNVGTLVASISLVGVAGGLYAGSWTPSLEGYFQVRYEFFFDPGLAVSAGYEVQGETIDVTAFKTNILRILGLLHENSLVDLNVYDSEGNLTSSRIRTYDTPANCAMAASVSPASYNTGLIFQYTVTAQYSGGALSKYFIERQV